MDNYKNNLEAIWDNQYKHNEDTALKDENLFQLEFNAIYSEIFNNLGSRKKIKILELGCGTGFLINKLINKFNNLDILLDCSCVDFSEKAIDSAKKKNIQNVTFYNKDFFDFFEQSYESYDFIITQRSIMAVMDKTKQIKLLDNIKSSLNKVGIGILSECFEEQLLKLNSARAIMGLKEIEKVWHSLYLTNDQLNIVFNNVHFKDFCSTYFFVTRVIYPFFENPLHNQDIHKKAFQLPNSGDFGFLRLAIVTN